MIKAWRRQRTLDRWAAGLAAGAQDPREGQLLSPHPGVAYLPIPKAANTAIRIAMLPLFGGASSDLARPSRVHRHPSIERRNVSEGLATLDIDALVFTVVRHPAARLRSAWKNKVASHRSFGPARRLGLGRTTSFRRFLEVMACTPQGALDGHFRAQSIYLSNALGDNRLQVIRMEDLAEHWPDLASQMAAITGIAPDPLETFNATGAGQAKPFSTEHRRLISYAYGDDLRAFGYGWSEDGLPVVSGPIRALDKAL